MDVSYFAPILIIWYYARSTLIPNSSYQEVIRLNLDFDKRISNEQNTFSHFTARLQIHCQGPLTITLRCEVDRDVKNKYHLKR